MLLACRQPERVERLVIVDIAPRGYFWPAHRASFAAMNELDLRDLRSRAEAELRFEARVPAAGTRKFLATNLERNEAGVWSWLVNLPVLTDALERLEANPLGETDRYEGPVRFLAGGLSDYIEPRDHEVIRRHFPRAEVRVLHGCGHNPHMEARAEFVERKAGGTGRRRGDLAGVTFGPRDELFLEGEDGAGEAQDRDHQAGDEPGDEVDPEHGLAKHQGFTICNQWPCENRFRAYSQCVEEQLRSLREEDLI